MEIQGKRLPSEKDRVKKTKKVCYVCGDRGFSQLIVNCSECSDLAIHWYCLGIIPGSENNTNVTNWVCESCALMESKPCETALVEDQPEILRKLPPKSLPEILEEEEEERKKQFQHSGETLVPMTVSYKEVALSPFIEHPEEISQGLVLIASSSGEITIHESREFEDGENGEEYSIEDTMELDFGAEEQIDSGFLSETVELNFGTDEENNESQSSKPHDSPEMSIPASVLDMANEFLETTLERIDVNVGPYKIRSDLAPILRNLLSKYSDIFHDCIVEPDIFLVTVCQAIQYLQTIPFKNLRQQYIDYIRDTLKFPDACAVNVEWLEKHCDYLQEVVHQTVNYIALKEEWDETARNVRLKKKMVGSSGSKQELMIMEDETGGEEGHLRELEDNMKSIKSLWRRISSKSLVDGLF